ncbi:MAG: fimbria/pilus outer membrane usher protein [Steroidobacteraceae bacterium]
MRRTTVAFIGLLLARAALADEAWLDVVVNGEQKGESVLVHVGDDGSVSIGEDDFLAMRIGLPLDATGATVRSGRVRLADRPGIELHVDEEEGRLELTIAPWLLPETFMTGDARQHLPEPGIPALFANYDIQAQLAGTSSLAARAELGASAGRVSFTNTMYFLDSRDSGRLDTTLRVDVPERRAVLSLGDTISRTTGNNPAFRFGGVQWATDFATQPGFIPYSLPVARGVATVPSTVDLFINGARVAQRDIPAGPFAISDLPLTTGQGQIEMRVRDAYGNEQLIRDSFLAAPSLLREGLSAYSVEAGALRQNYASPAESYGPGFVAMSLRRGMNERLTLDGAVQALERLQNVRVGMAGRLSSLLLADASVTASHGRRGNGQAGDASLALVLSGLTATTQMRLFSDAFEDIGRIGRSDGVRREVSAQLSAHVPGGTSLSLGHVRRAGLTSSGDAEVTLFSVSRSRFLGGALSLQATRVNASGGGWSWSLIYAKQDAAARSVSSLVTHDSSGTSLSAQVARDGGVGPGRDWSLAGRLGGQSSLNARTALRTLQGRGDLEFAQVESESALRGAWHGGWLFAAGQSQFTSPFSGAVALVEAPGLRSVVVQQDGQALGLTNNEGRLIATTLRAFDANEIRIDSSTLPLEGWLETEERVVRPYSRGVLAVRFASSAVAISVALRQRDGTPVPIGARVVEPAGGWPVGDGGLATVPGDVDVPFVKVEWAGGSCRAPMPVATAGTNRGEIQELRCE